VRRNPARSFAQKEERHAAWSGETNTAADVDVIWHEGCRYGLRLPPEEDCLLGINMQLSLQRKGKADETLPDR
jgi:hypothetical protein